MSSSIHGTCKRICRDNFYSNNDNCGGLGRFDRILNQSFRLFLETSTDSGGRQRRQSTYTGSKIVVLSGGLYEWREDVYKTEKREPSQTDFFFGRTQWVVDGGGSRGVALSPNGTGRWLVRE